MKNRSITCTLFIFLSFLFSENIYCQIPRSEQIVNTLMGQTAQRISQKYPSRPVGVCIGMPGNVINLLGLEFDIAGSLTKAEIRKLLFNFSDELLSAINKDTSIRPFLECYPFTRNKIKIVLYFKDKNYSVIESPQISVASIKKGKIEYLNLITLDDILKIESEYVETEEDALKALNE